MTMAGQRPRSSASPVKAIVLMGVSGSGKSTTGTRLGARLGWPFRDADSFHPPANIAKMSRGEPLNDADRLPWLTAIAAWIDEQRALGAPAIVSCSALKRRYRDILLAGRPDVKLVFLRGDRALIGDRMQRRKGHFMPSALLESQFAALEEPGADEKALVVSVAASPKKVVAKIVAELGLTAASPLTPAAD